jgi:putative flippase GtrA
LIVEGAVVKTIFIASAMNAAMLIGVALAYMPTERLVVYTDSEQVVLIRLAIMVVVGSLAGLVSQLGETDIPKPRLLVFRSVASGLAGVIVILGIEYLTKIKIVEFEIGGTIFGGLVGYKRIVLPLARAMGVALSRYGGGGSD